MLIHRTTLTSIAFTLSLLLALGVTTVAHSAEILRTLWQGQWVDYVEQGDYAVTEGDIIIGPKDAVREWSRALALGAQQTAEQRKALTIDVASRLWLRGASGVIEVPFTIEAGDNANINAAVTEVNRALTGVLKWVPRSAEVDYVAFSLTATGPGACASAVGRAGGRQIIQGDAVCAVSTLVHEMGHAIGLWHGQQDADATPFLDIRLNRMEPSKRGNSQPRFNTRTFGGYDYSSIMHYARGGFAAFPDRIVHETKPAGIDLAVASTYSTGDLEAIARLYGAPPTRTTVTSNPPGLRLMVDGVEVITPAVFNWPMGSVHRVWAAPDLQTLNNYKFAFGRWSHDAGATPSPQLSWQVTAGDGSLGSPTTSSSATLLTANFVRLIDVTTSPTTGVGGSASVTPRSPAWPGSSTLFPQSTIFDLRATPNAGYLNYATFGSATAFGGGIGVRPSVALIVGGGVAAQTIGYSFHTGPTLAVDVVGDGMSDGLGIKITAPAAASTTSFSPRISRNTLGTWKYEFTSPQYLGTSIRYIVDSLTGFDNAASGEVAMPASGVRTVTVNAHRELTPFKQVVPSCAGSITFSDNNTWLRTGAPLSVTLTTNTSAIFTGWTGTASGTAKSLTTVVGEQIPEFVATFNSIAEPLRLSSISPKVFGDDTALTTVLLRGAGFTPSSVVTVAGAVVGSTFIDSGTLSVSLSRNQFPDAGRLAAFVTNALSGACNVVSNSLGVDVLPIGTSVGVTLVEYYIASLDYYFLTGRAGDKAALDALPTVFTRTGQQIKMYAAPNVDTLPLERHYFDKVARGGSRGSHFFTALPSDQVLMTSLNPTNAAQPAKPLLEGIEGYAIPKTTTGTCPVGSTPIYRAFKGAPRYLDDGNHRFSTSTAQHQDMVNRLGWVDEGVVFCGLQ
jgi:hypothetical protein